MVTGELLDGGVPGAGILCSGITGDTDNASKTNGTDNANGTNNANDADNTGSTGKTSYGRARSARVWRAVYNCSPEALQHP